ncbi:Protein CBG13807 [Caenorhabditis briggsae]|uniref:Protein CBG13807 n=1 Tax=Caenorhabditis briggsae TaxID=6238 RepID=A8XIR2_CAEBR|nr:Protein CBG13807 [Caenorhabditis briggsae]CAP32537.2 Protein CBG13807 [Caenorhabditis briggsae]
MYPFSDKKRITHQEYQQNVYYDEFPSSRSLDSRWSDSGESQESIASSSSSTAPFRPTFSARIIEKTVKKKILNLGLCLICEVDATGINYGVKTCEGCKKFFHRNHPNSLKLRCKKRSKTKCSINPTNRTECQACRFQKCLDYGMTMDKPVDDVLKMTREQKILFMKLAHWIIEVHMRECVLTETGLEKFGESEMIKIAHDMHPVDRRFDAWTIIIPEMNREISSIISFVRDTRLLEDCQNPPEVLKTTMFQAFCLRVARGLSPKGWMFSDGRTLDSECLELIFGDDLTRDLVKLSNLIKLNFVTDEDLGMMIAQVVVHPRNGFKDLEFHYENVFNAFRVKMRKREHEKAMMTAISEILEHLEKIGAQQKAQAYHLLILGPKRNMRLGRRKDLLMSVGNKIMSVKQYSRRFVDNF